MCSLRVCLVAILLVSAGCLSDPGVGISNDGEPVREPVVVPVQQDRSGDGSLPDGRLTDRRPEDSRLNSPPSTNPWGADPVVVAVETPPESDGEYTDAVAEAVAYWNRNGDRFGKYDTRFVLRPNDTDPNVVVRFDSTVVCNDKEVWLGCAPVLDGTTADDAPTVVQINAEYDSDVIGRTVKHEFGHLLGIRHGEDPMPLMEPVRDVESPELPGVGERENPWRGRVIEVYVDYGAMDDERRADTRAQIQRALSYYNDGAEGAVPANLTFIETDVRAEAEITVEFLDNPWCREGAGSCAETRGIDMDDDATVEYHTSTKVAISNVRTDAVGWHLGYWLGEAMGADDRTELPPPFRSNANRTGQWWETDR